MTRTMYIGICLAGLISLAEFSAVQQGHSQSFTKPSGDRQVGEKEISFSTAEPRSALYFTNPLYEQFDIIEHKVISPSLETWTIEKPNPKQRTTKYSQIRFRPEDVITIQSGGCVQTGGTGKSWKLYVNPQGPNSDRLYHGLIGIPKPDISRFRESAVVAKTVRIEDLINEQNRGYKWTIHDSKDEHEGDLGFSYLVLGYEDEDYLDNGYTGHDDGTGDQCRGVASAWVKVQIKHHIDTKGRAVRQ